MPLAVGVFEDAHALDFTKIVSAEDSAQRVYQDCDHVHAIPSPTLKFFALEILGMTADRGVPVSQKAWREASGVAAPDEGEAVIEKSQAPMLQDSAFGANDAESDIDELSRAMSTEKKQALLAELDRIEAMDDASQRADALANLQRNISNYFDGGDAEAEAMMKILERRISNEK